MSSISTHVLECGLPLIVEEIPGVRSVAATWLIPAGSAADPDDRQGLCALWHELLHRGAGELDSRSQADALDRLGISRATDVGTFHLSTSFVLLGAGLMDGLGMMHDMVLRPRFDGESIEPARDLCVQSIKSLQDDPQERAVLAARARHNPSPINRSGLGTEDGLGAITAADIREQWRMRATPVAPTRGKGGRSILAVAGEVASAGGADAIARRLDELCAGWRSDLGWGSKDSNGAPPVVEWGEAALRGTYEHITDVSSQVQVVVVYDAPPEPSPDAILERVVGSVLSGGMSCRLFSEVREKRGLCYSVSQTYATDRQYGRCLAYVGTTPERAQDSLNVLVEQLRAICGRAVGGGGVLIAPDEFERAMIGIKSRLVFSGESTSARAGALAGDMHRLGRPRSLAEIAAAYDAVTLDAVNGYLERRRLGPFTVVTLGPGDGLKWTG